MVELTKTAFNGSFHLHQMHMDKKNCSMTITRVVTGFITMLLGMQAIGANRNAARQCGSFYMQNLPAQALCNLKVPIRLNLAHCQIKTVDKDAFVCSEDLEELCLNSNMISSLPAAVFRRSSALIILHLEGE